MFFFLPLYVDVPMQRWPWMNWVLIGLTVIFFPLCYSWPHDFSPLGEHLMLNGDSKLGLVGHVLVHGGLLHLLGNMLFLWVFGNAICAKVGNLAYPFVYFGIGLAVGFVYSLFNSRPTVGASDAVNGIVGMFVVWYLFNEITCGYAYWALMAADANTVEVSSFWVILLWLVFDLLGVLGGGGHVAHSAHLIGFALGFLLAVLLLVFRLVEMDPGERSLLQALSWNTQPESRPKKRRKAGGATPRLRPPTPLETPPPRLMVSDIDKTIEFYEGILGIEAESSDSGRTALAFANQKIYLDSASASLKQGADQPAFEVPDLCLLTETRMARVVRYLQRHGVTIEDGPVSRKSGKQDMTSVFIRDPDNHLIELSSYS